MSSRLEILANCRLFCPGVWELVNGTPVEVDRQLDLYLRTTPRLLGYAGGIGLAEIEELMQGYVVNVRDGNGTILSSRVAPPWFTEGKRFQATLGDLLNLDADVSAIDGYFTLTRRVGRSGSGGLQGRKILELLGTPVSGRFRTGDAT